MESFRNLAGSMGVESITLKETTKIWEVSRITGSMRFSNKKLVGTSGLLHFYDIPVQVPILFLLCWTGRSPYGTLPVAAETDPCCDVLFTSDSIGGRSSFKRSLCESKSFSNNSLSQPRLTSCQLLSMVSIVFV